MDYAAAFLFTDSKAGCRLFSLTLGGDGGEWTDVTGQEDVFASSLVSPNARSETYRLPPKAEEGGYLFCVMPDGPEADPDDEVCGQFDL